MRNYYPIVLIVASLSVLAVGLLSGKSSIASTCSSTVSAKWACGSTVYYSLSGFDTTQTTKIGEAISEWNSLSNSSKVTLTAAGGGHSATLQFIASTTGDNCTSGHFDTHGTPTVTSAEIYYHFSNTCAPSGGGATFDVYDSASTTAYESFLVKVTLHEIGHTMGLAHSTATTETSQCAFEDGKTIMNPWCNTNDSGNNLPTSISTCDKTNLLTLCPTPTPTPTPTPVPLPSQCSNAGGTWNYFANYCTGISISTCETSLGWTFTSTAEGERCYPECEPEAEVYECENQGGIWRNCRCYLYSPIIIDVSGDGFALTGADQGVSFDIDANGIPEQLSWTSAGSDDAFLVLDRNNTGTVENGSELFGNYSPQPAPPSGQQKNGFLALAEYDKTGNGGNGDGFITRNDSIFASLRLWQDTNHNGVSESTELHRVSDLGLRKIELVYHESDRIDQYGNRFRYRAKVRDAHDAQLGRWAWDVFLVTQP